MNKDIAMQHMQNGAQLSQISSSHQKTMGIQRLRNMREVEALCLSEAEEEGIYYEFPIGGEVVRDLSIGGALALARCYGNCAAECSGLKSLDEEWIFKASFVDFENNVVTTKQYRQSKKSKVFLKTSDPERLMNIRFEIGQSKALRNAITAGTPKALQRKMVEHARQSVIGRISASLKDKDKRRTTINAIIKNMNALGVSRAMITEKYIKKSTESIYNLPLDVLVDLHNQHISCTKGDQVIGNFWDISNKESVGIKERLSGADKKDKMAAFIEEWSEQPTEERIALFVSLGTEKKRTELLSKYKRPFNRLPAITQAGILWELKK